VITRAYVLVTVEPRKTKQVLKTLANKDNVRHVNSVSGRYDVVLEISAKDVREISDAVVSNLRAIDGIRGTETLLVYE